jgi:hypothetical protein
MKEMIEINKKQQQEPKLNKLLNRPGMAEYMHALDKTLGNNRKRQSSRISYYDESVSCEVNENEEVVHHNVVSKEPTIEEKKKMKKEKKRGIKRISTMKIENLSKIEEGKDDLFPKKIVGIEVTRRCLRVVFAVGLVSIMLALACAGIASIFWRRSPSFTFKNSSDCKLYSMLFVFYFACRTKPI